MSAWLARTLAAPVAAALVGLAASGLAEPALVELDAPELAVLVGPLTAIPAETRGRPHFDARMLTLGRRHATAFPEKADDLIASTYYDLALVLYTAYYRTRDPFWREQARRVARTWRDSPHNQRIPAALDGDESAGPLVPPPRSLATLGLAVLAVESGDAEARRLVHVHARLIEERWVGTRNVYGLANPVMPMGDAREAGYGLLALVASTLLGEDHRVGARQLLDAILARQQPSGQWESWTESSPGQRFTLNYMNGLLMEGLIMYDRVIGDPRIVPALQRAVAWTWQTQWVKGARGFQYCDRKLGDLTRNPEPVLNGLLLVAWGYLSARTGDPRYRAQGDLILDGLVSALDAEVHGVKQFDQVYRSSARYLGFRVEGAGAAQPRARGRDNRLLRSPGAA